MEHHTVDGGAKRPFRFVNILAEHEEFLRTLADTWGVQVQGSVRYKLWYNLNLCKSPLRNLMQTHMGSIDRRVQKPREKLQIIQAQITHVMETRNGQY